MKVASMDPMPKDKKLNIPFVIFITLLLATLIGLIIISISKLFIYLFKLMRSHYIITAIILIVIIFLIRKFRRKKIK